MIETNTGTPDTHEALKRLEMDLGRAVSESFDTNTARITVGEDGSEHVDLYYQPFEGNVSPLQVNRGPRDDEGNRVTYMAPKTIAEARSGRRAGGYNMADPRPTSHIHGWRLTESASQPPRLEAGHHAPTGEFVPFDATHPEFGYLAEEGVRLQVGKDFPAILRQGSPDNPLRKSRFGGKLGEYVLGQVLSPLEHVSYE